MAKRLKRHVTGYEHVRTPDSSILNVNFIFGKGGEDFVNLPGTFMKELNVFENMRYLCDHVSFIFDDRMAMLSEMIPFSGTEKCIIEYGQDIYSTQSSAHHKDKARKTRYGVYDIFKTNYVPTDLANPSNWEMEIFLINSLAKSLFNETHCRTFEDLTISQIIERLIEPCRSDYIKEGDLNIDIEETTERGTFTQPMGWTNAQMINYLTELAGDYVFMIYGTNIIFKSISSLMSVRKPLETCWISHEEYNHRLSDQKYLLILDSKFHLNNYFFNTVGGRGVTYRGYDFDQKKDLSTISTVTSQQPIAFGEKFPIESEDISNRGRYKVTGLKDQRFLNNKAKYKNINPFMNILISYVVTMGRANREPGNIIETVYQTSQENELYNSVYSGEWLISAITHSFKGQAKQYVQRLELRRNAFGRGSERLVTPENVKRTTDTISKIEREMKGR